MESKHEVSVIVDDVVAEGCPKCDLMRGEPDKALLRLHLFLDHHKKRWEAKLDSVAAMPIGPGKWEVTCQRCESKVTSATQEGARSALVGHSAVRHVELSDVLEEVDPLSRDLAARLYLNSGPTGAAKATAAAV